MDKRRNIIDEPWESLEDRIISKGGYEGRAAEILKLKREGWNTDMLFRKGEYYEESKVSVLMDDEYDRRVFDGEIEPAQSKYLHLTGYEPTNDGNHVLMDAFVVRIVSEALIDDNRSWGQHLMMRDYYKLTKDATIDKKVAFTIGQFRYFLEIYKNSSWTHVGFENRLTEITIPEDVFDR